MANRRGDVSGAAADAAIGADRMNPAERFGRRAWLGGAVMTPLVFSMRPDRASAAEPKLQELAYPALMLRAPSHVFLVAGARIGNRLFAAGIEGVIIYSDDAGRSWTQARVPVSVTVTAIAFASPQIGWAAGGFGVILNTRDGGKTWQKQLDGVGVIRLMQAATQAFAATRPPDDDMAARATRRDGILAGEGPDKPFLTILPISEQEAFVFGAYRMAVRTTDGGQSWTDWSFHIADPISHNIYDAAAISGKYYLVGETGLIFCSSDGGQNFLQAGQPGTATLFGVCDAGSGNILVYGVAGQIFWSADGTNWTASVLPSSTNLTAVAQMPGGALVAADESGAFYISRNHGRNFTPVFQSPLMLVSDLIAINATSVLLVSAAGAMPVNISVS